MHLLLLFFHHCHCINLVCNLLYGLVFSLVFSFCCYVVIAVTLTHLLTLLPSLCHCHCVCRLCVCIRGGVVADVAVLVCTCSPHQITTHTNTLSCSGKKVKKSLPLHD